MTRTIVARWQDWSGQGLEHLVLHEAPDGFWAEAVVLGTAGERPFAVRYRIRCDRQWRTRKVEVGVIGDERPVTVMSDGAGAWTDGSGQPLPHLQGAIDVDLSATPFTNTLPIRRFGLGTGQSAKVLAVYVLVPDLTVTTDRQRYTCLEPGRRYRYESVDGDFTREIEVDGDGLVVTYPGLFRRLL